MAAAAKQSNADPFDETFFQELRSRLQTEGALQIKFYRDYFG
jgi:hypothetical protein